MIGIIRAVIVSICIIVTSHNSFGEQRYCYQEGSKIKGLVSKENLNRIWFSDKHIIEVIGDSAKYKILQDAVGKNLFFTPYASVGEDIEITVIESGGRAIDLSLRVVGGSKGREGQLILIEDKKECSHREDNRVEIASLMRHMCGGKQGKYIVEQVKREIPVLEREGLKIKQDMSYRYGPYVGARLRVSNASSELFRNGKDIELTDSILSKIFAGEDVIIRKDCSVLGSGRSCNVWVALKEVESD